MKKVLAIVLCAVLAVSMFSLAGCGVKAELKMGLGVYSYLDSVASAEDDKNGSANAVTTVAAVLLDTSGKIVKAVIDVADNKLQFTSAGEFVAAGEFKTKGEAKEEYGMKAYAGAAKEWYEQADAFCALLVGKTVQEVNAMVATDGKGNTDVVNAGCTIVVTDFVKAVEKAIANATESKATKDDTLQLGVVSVQTGAKTAGGDVSGANEADTTIAAAAVNKDGKVNAMVIDAVAAVVKFDATGKTANQTGEEITSKGDAGEKYGMAAYGNDRNGDGVVKEWNEQAKVFANACLNKNAAEISALAAENGYAVADVQTAGCTVNVADFVKAAVKACTIA